MGCRGGWVEIHRESVFLDFFLSFQCGGRHYHVQVEVERIRRENKKDEVVVVVDGIPKENCRQNS